MITLIDMIVAWATLMILDCFLVGILSVIMILLGTAGVDTAIVIWLGSLIFVPPAAMILLFLFGMGLGAKGEADRYRNRPF